MGISELITKAFLGDEPSQYPGLIEIHGLIRGDINKVVITPSGSLYGRITAKEVEIAGLVDGDIETENLIVHPSGRLYYGYLNYNRISSEDGSTVIDKTTRGQVFQHSTHINGNNSFTDKVVELQKATELPREPRSPEKKSSGPKTYTQEPHPDKQAVQFFTSY
jgi:cytoskeletal protein CcmA (bactofilin family)